jgi:predicted ferric reductase
MTALSSYKRSKGRSAMGKLAKTVGLVALVGSMYLVVLAVLWLAQSSLGQPIATAITSLFAVNSVQAWWYVTRAAGLTSYILLWLSMVWGMAISTKILSPAVAGDDSYDFHEFLSLLGLGFVLLHVIVLALDKFLPFSIWQILIPFIDSYRPLWVGLGVIGFYLFLLVTVTFYMRQAIGSKAFRSIHMLSLIGYLGATLHGLFAGTDSALPVAKLLYALTFLVVIFLTAYWLVIRAPAKKSIQPAIASGPARANPPKRMNSR